MGWGNRTPVINCCSPTFCNTCSLCLAGQTKWSHIRRHHSLITSLLIVSPQVCVVCSFPYNVQITSPFFFYQNPPPPSVEAPVSIRGGWEPELIVILQTEALLANCSSLPWELKWPPYILYAFHRYGSVLESDSELCGFAPRRLFSQWIVGSIYIFKSRVIRV